MDQSVSALADARFDKITFMPRMHIVEGDLMTANFPLISTHTSRRACTSCICVRVCMYTYTRRKKGSKLVILVFIIIVTLNIVIIIFFTLKLVS